MNDEFDSISNVQELHQRYTFVREGHMLALPLAFPAVSTRLDPNDSPLVALEVTEAGTVYALTVGERSHLVVAMTRGTTGFCFDMGVVPGAEPARAVAGLEDAVLVAAGQKVWPHAHFPRPFDCIQEWGFTREPFGEACLQVDSGPIVDLLADPNGSRLVVATPEEIVLTEFKNGAGRVLRSWPADVPPDARLVLSGDGLVCGLDTAGACWTLDLDAMEVARDVCGPGPAAQAAVLCAEPGRGTLLAGSGRKVWRLDPAAGTAGQVGELELGPITALACTLDGRAFGFCGVQMQHLFVCDAPDGPARDLGVALSVLSERRYGYSFVDAAVGTQGEIFFAEHDRGACLWLYFPALVPSE